jgi:hypothetical protein
VAELLVRRLVAIREAGTPPPPPPPPPPPAEVLVDRLVEVVATSSWSCEWQAPPAPPSKPR